MYTGTQVGVSVYGIHHNLDVWDNPEVQSYHLAKVYQNIRV